MRTENNQLKSIIERIERLEEERKALADDIKDVLTEAKHSGFEPKIIRKVIALRRLPPAEREELQLMIATYMQAL
jgi:uncharacterized protein (UPF0335 family)